MLAGRHQPLRQPARAKLRGAARDPPAGETTLAPPGRRLGDSISRAGCSCERQIRRPQSLSILGLVQEVTPGPPRHAHRPRQAGRGPAGRRWAVPPPSAPARAGPCRWRAKRSPPPLLLPGKPGRHRSTASKEGLRIRNAAGRFEGRLSGPPPAPSWLLGGRDNRLASPAANSQVGSESATLRQGLPEPEFGAGSAA